MREYPQRPSTPRRQTHKTTTPCRLPGQERQAARLVVPGDYKHSILSDNYFPLRCPVIATITPPVPLPEITTRKHLVNGSSLLRLCSTVQSGNFKHLSPLKQQERQPRYNVPPSERVHTVTPARRYSNTHALASDCAYRDVHYSLP